MEQLAQEQCALGEEIQRIVRNYKKDSAERKTNATYFKERLSDLETHWAKFEENDNRIRSLPEPQLSHEYFTKEYYSVMKELYSKYSDIFLQNLAKLEERQASGTDTDTEPQAASRPFETRPSHTEAAIELELRRPDQKHLTEKPGEARKIQCHQISRLIRRQKGIIDPLRRFLLTVTTDEALPKSYYELKIKTISHYWEQIENLNYSIRESEDDPALAGYDDSAYIQLEQAVQEQVTALATIMGQQGEPARHDSTKVNTTLKLPKLTLPKFDGEYLKWGQFHDLFSEMVDKQPMAACQKMWYLKTNLVGEAERLVRHLTLSDNNYEATWKILNNRYNNPRLLVAAFVNRIMSLPAHTSENVSANAIKSLHDTTQECLRGLENLGVPVDKWDALLLHILLRKLDKTTHTLYEQSLADPKQLQTITDFLSFLENRFQSIEALGSKGRNPNEVQGRHSVVKSFTSVATSAFKCVTCKGNHQLFACKEFLQLSPVARLSVLKRHNLCINCMRRGHNSTKCTSRGCIKCNRKHNTLIHIDPLDKREKQEGVASTTSPRLPKRDEEDEQTTSLAAINNKLQEGYVFLSTAVVKLTNNNGDTIEARAILDSGSQVTLITERVMRKLKLPSIHKPMIVQGIGQTQKQAQRRASMIVQSKINNYTARVEAIVLPHIIAPQPTHYVDTSEWPMPKNIKLADPRFNKPGRIDLLIGAEFYHQLLAVGQIKLGNEFPVLQNTVLGWIIAGKVNGSPMHTATCSIYTTEESLERNIERFWKIESGADSQPKLTAAEKRCEAHFNQTVTRSASGRFTVSLPFSDDPTKLGESSEIALKRFHSLERKLARDAQLKEQYIKFMNEYIDLGHMEELDIEDILTPHYFLPHHCVIKPDSSSTKLRVVFDASAKTSSNISLNDILHSGPLIQDELFSILLRFRTPRYVLIADIEKMYRQISLHENDKRYHLIWWRSDPSQPLKCYQLCTVTYGTTSAPYLAIRCLQKLANDHSTTYPLGSQVLKNDFYVDDVMTGTDSLSVAKEIQAQLTGLLREGGFKLRKWCANHQQLLQDILPEDQEILLDYSDKEGAIKTLGLTWLPYSDQFCTRPNWTIEKRTTKRSVASDIARIFDPLGIMAPVVITAKIFLQELWKLKLDWDATLPQEMHTRWTKYREGLTSLSKIKFPRHVFAQKKPKSVQIHTFADASESAYGAVVYLRSITNDGDVIVRLLCAKSRVAPIQKLTLPRLELSAAKLAAELSSRVKSDLRIEFASTYFWTDSEIVLNWINSASASFQTFVANRIATIQELTNSQQWRHVRSIDNPADVLSRGIAPEKFQGHNLWFYGPTFLHGNESIWPQPFNPAINTQNHTDMEIKKRALPITTKTEKCEEFIYSINHGNSFRKLQRVTAYVLRFVSMLKERRLHHFRSNLKRGSSKSTPSKESWPLSSEELEDALYFIVKAIQDDDFKTDIRQLRKHKELNKDSALISLSPFLDEKGILRVGGRLEASNLTFDAKHPMLPPYGDQFVNLLMTDIHKENLHVAPQGLLSITRQKFWPIKGKTIARSVVQHCVRCAKAKPKMFAQMMGSLPPHRIQPARPFINTGVDFCGPMWVHYRSRGSRPQKSYVAIFCCFATKALHIEVVSDLSTEAFIGALKRFTGRRGHCKNLYCDNATNFVGAKNQLQELTNAIHSSKAQEKITTICSAKGINFHFIPPRAPHFGGLWEAAVKSAKYLMRRKVSSASLTYEELCTLMAEIEAILNSRPLTAMSSNPNDLTALAPGHFLIGEPLTATIDPHSAPRKVSLLKRWNLVSDIKNQFWDRWSHEYLNELQQRVKWKKACENAQPGTIVVLQEDNTPVMSWPLGRIVKTYKGPDNLVRTADVLTRSGILRRMIHKLAPLPCGDYTQQSTEQHASDEELASLQQLKRSRDTEIKDNKQCSATNVKGEATLTTSKSTKRRKGMSYGSAILTLLLTCLIMPITRANNIEVTPFDSRLGIYFDNVGTVNLITSEWSLVVYYDLQPYWQELELLQNSSNTLRHLCDQITKKTSCRPIIQQFRNLEKELRQDDQLLNNRLTSNRKRRGAIDIVGNIANSLFGLLDSRYAEQMSMTINNVHENADHLLRLVKNQTSLLESTVNLMKRDQEAIEKRHQALDQQLTEIINRINNNTEESYQLKIQQLFTSWSIHTILIVTNLQRIQDSLIDVISDAHQGKISHLLLSPSQLKEEINNIRSYLPPSIRLPVNPDKNLLQLFKLMTTEGRIVNNHVIFRLRLPLCSLQELNLFKMTSIPTNVNDSLIDIAPSSTFLAISPHQDQYYPLTEQQIASCTAVEGSKMLCSQTHPLYQRGANVSKCEVNFLNNITNLSECKIKKIEYSPLWTQLHNVNQWIYALTRKTLVNVVCNGEASQLTLEGSGIIKLSSDCVLKNNLMTITGHRIYPSTRRVSYTKLSEAANDISVEHRIPLTIDTPRYQAKVKEIEALLDKIATQNRETPAQFHRNNIQHTTISSLGLILTISLIVLLGWKFRKAICKGKAIRPTPSPRTLPASSNFSINVE